MLTSNAITFEFNILNTVYLTTSLSTSTGAVGNSAMPESFTSVFKLFKCARTVFNLSISHLSTSLFKLIKSTFLANDDGSTPVGFLHQVFLLS